MQKLMLVIALCFCQMILAADNGLPTQDGDDSVVEDASGGNLVTEDTESELVSEDEDLVLADIEKTSEVEEESSSRFIPTEQISQDLGVSFPIDI